MYELKIILNRTQHFKDNDLRVTHRNVRSLSGYDAFALAGMTRIANLYAIGNTKREIPSNEQLRFP